jgi:hypothetical protein
MVLSYFKVNFAHSLRGGGLLHLFNIARHSLLSFTLGHLSLIYLQEFVVQSKSSKIGQTSTTYPHASYLLAALPFTAFTKKSQVIFLLKHC